MCEKMNKKNCNNDTRQEEIEWYALSLAGAVRGIEDDAIPDYTEADFKEKWTR